jgi:hypothetical protein
VGNLFLRVGFALSIVLAAIGMSVAAPGAVARCDREACAPVASVSPVVAGYQAAPQTAERGLPAPSNADAQQAATLVALASAVVFLAVFAILWSYRPRPGGVRVPDR